MDVKIDVKRAAAHAKEYVDKKRKDPQSSWEIKALRVFRADNRT